MIIHQKWMYFLWAEIGFSLMLSLTDCQYFTKIEKGAVTFETAPF